MSAKRDLEIADAVLSAARAALFIDMDGEVSWDEVDFSEILDNIPPEPTPLTPDGWKWVPIEPTDSMSAAVAHRAMQPAPSVTDETQSRANFEAWQRKEYDESDFGMNKDGEYRSRDLQYDWLSWQASRAALREVSK